MPLTWIAWNNGQHTLTGAGYGFKVPIADRDQYFRRDSKTISLDLPSNGGHKTISINTNKASFWNDTCHELISHEIGKWLISIGLAPWQTGKPPKILVEFLANDSFRVVGAK